MIDFGRFWKIREKNTKDHIVSCLRGPSCSSWRESCYPRPRRGSRPSRR